MAIGIRRSYRSRKVVYERFRSRKDSIWKENIWKVYE